MTTTTTTFAEVSKDSHVATVTMRASGKAPRMGGAFWSEMPALFASLDADDVDSPRRAFDLGQL